MTPVLSVDNVKKRFGGIVAVDGLNLEVEPGEIVGLIGPNGAGKTTTLNLITGFLTPNEGRISLNGTEVTGDSPDSISKSGIGRTFQISKPFGRLSVYENLLVPNVSCGPTEQEARIDRLLKSYTLRRYGRTAPTSSVAARRNCSNSREC